MKKILFVLNPEMDLSDYLVPILNNRGSQYGSFDRVNSIDLAIDLISKSYKDYSLIIMEVSMRSLGIFSLEETKKNRITGIVLFEKESLVLSRTPVIFWSRLRDHQKYVSILRHRYQNHNISFLQKTNEEDDYLNLLSKIKMVSAIDNSVFISNDFSKIG